MSLIRTFAKFYFNRTPANATSLRRAIKLALPQVGK